MARKPELDPYRAMKLVCRHCGRAEYLLEVRPTRIELGGGLIGAALRSFDAMTQREVDEIFHSVHSGFDPQRHRLDVGFVGINTLCSQCQRQEYLAKPLSKSERGVLLIRLSDTRGSW